MGQSWNRHKNHDWDKVRLGILVRKKFAKSYTVLTRKLIKSSIYLSTEDFIIFTIFLTHPSTCPTEPRTISQSQWPETFGNHIILYSIYRRVRSLRSDMKKIHVLTYLRLQTGISNSNSIKKELRFGQ